MMKFFKLEELCTEIIDCPHSTPKWLNKGIPVIRNYNLNNRGIDLTNLSFVDEETYFKRIKRAKPEAGDIVISREAPMGVVGMIPSNFKCCLGQRLVLLKVNKKKCNPKYLVYALTSKFVQKQIRRIDLTGSIVSNLNIPDLKSLLIPITEKQQDDCAYFLDAIDRKIELNNKINAELETMAKTLYDYWFLQFEFPNEEGKPYKSSGGKMVYNEQLKREIPEGWEVKELGTQIIENEKSSIQVNKVENYGNIPFFTSGEDVLNCSKSLVSGLNIYMSTGGNANIKIYFGEASYSTDTWCFNCLKNTIYIYEYIMTIKQQINDNYFDGSGLKHLKKEAFKKILLCVPDNRIIENFNDLILSFFKMISKYKYENQELSSLRDFLLPLLMNGQVTFKDENEELENEVKKCVSINNFEGFNQWKQIQGYAARGEADDEILKKIYDAMDDDDKK